MYANLGPGQMIDLEPPSPNGVDLLYSHKYVANRRRRRLAERTNLYAYVVNNPVNLVDPLGLQAAPGGAAADQSEEKFYVCRRLVEVQGVARACGCQHTDIYGSQSGEVYQGFGGPITPGGQGLPQGAGWQCDELTRADFDFVERPLGRVDLVPKKFRWGPNAGKSCEDATSADILACLQAKPKPPGKPGLITNCQTDVFEAAEGCCLRGQTPLSILPVRPLPPGPKF